MQNIFNKYKWIVESEASKYYMVVKKLSADIEYEDLIQEGLAALYIAAKTVNDNGADFATYAKTVVRYNLRRAICQGNIINIPEKKLSDYSNIIRAMEEYNGEPDYKAIAARLGLTERAVLSTIRLVENAEDISSLNAPLSEEDNEAEEIINFVKDESTNIEKTITENETDKEINQTVKALLNVLTQNELKIIQYRFGFFGEPVKTLVEIGNIMGYSRETIRRIEKEAIKKMKTRISSEMLQRLLAA